MVRSSERRAQAKLIIRIAGHEPLSALLERDTITLGRDPSCDIPLPSPFVSRLHARIEKHDDGHFISDAGSRNGTLLNGSEVTTATRLSHGDAISIANVEIWYLLDLLATQPTAEWPRKTTPRREPGVLLSVDESTHRVWVEGQRADLSLSPLEFKLLHFLYSHRGKVCTRDQIGDAVWGPGQYDYDMLYRLVQRVKEKIEPDPSQPRYIISYRGIGYSLKV